MKKILLILLVILASCCSSKPIEVKTDTRTDTVWVEVPDTKRVNDLIAELELWKDSVNYLNSTIKIEHYMNARRVAKINNYIKITERRPANKKYFYGWIRRTMAE